MTHHFVASEFYRALWLHTFDMLRVSLCGVVGFNDYRVLRLSCLKRSPIKLVGPMNKLVPFFGFMVRFPC